MKWPFRHVYFVTFDIKIVIKDQRRSRNKKTLRNSNTISVMVGSLPNVNNSPNITHTPAVNGSSKRNTRNSPTILVLNITVFPLKIYSIFAVQLLSIRSVSIIVLVDLVYE